VWVDEGLFQEGAAVGGGAVAGVAGDAAGDVGGVAAPLVGQGGVADQGAREGEELDARLAQDGVHGVHGAQAAHQDDGDAGRVGNGGGDGSGSRLRCNARAAVD